MLSTFQIYTVAIVVNPPQAVAGISDPCHSFRHRRLSPTGLVALLGISVRTPVGECEIDWPRLSEGRELLPSADPVFREPRQTENTISSIWWQVWRYIYQTYLVEKHR